MPRLASSRRARRGGCLSRIGRCEYAPSHNAQKPRTRPPSSALRQGIAEIAATARLHGGACPDDDRGRVPPRAAVGRALCPRERRAGLGAAARRRAPSGRAPLHTRGQVGAAAERGGVGRGSGAPADVAD
eukprot:3646626-Pleurochrysis_carterae.AAC.1